MKFLAKKNRFFKNAFSARFIGQFLKIDFLAENFTQKTSKMTKFRNPKFLNALYDAKGRCAHMWDSNKWDEISEFYTTEMRDIVNKNSSANLRLMETNRMTMEYRFEDGTRQPLMSDNVHKMTYLGNVPGGKQDFVPSLAIDSNIILNYFCNKKFGFVNTCCNK